MLNLLKKVFYPTPRITRLDLALQFPITILILTLSLKINMLATNQMGVSSLYAVLKHFSGLSILLCFINMAVLMIRRLHDANLSGVLMKHSILPLVIFKSDDFVNKYGDKPRTEKVMIKILTIFTLVGAQYLI